MNQQPAPLLTVRTDRAALIRIFRARGLTLLGVVVAGLIAIAIGVGDGDATLLAIGAVPMACAVTALTVFAQDYGGRMAVHVPVIVERAAITVDTRQGWITVPWEAVTEVRQRGRGMNEILVLHLAPGVTPASPGVHTDVLAAAWSTLTRSGLRVGGPGTGAGRATIAAAIGEATGGRLQTR